MHLYVDQLYFCKGYTVRSDKN